MDRSNKSLITQRRQSHNHYYETEVIDKDKYDSYIEILKNRKVL
jgi:hypothetical protein